MIDDMDSGGFDEAAPGNLENPVVSVIMPVYDVERFVEASIRSVLTQTLRDIEVIAIDDRSTDASRDIVDGMAAQDPRIRPVVLDRNVGQGMARNEGLELARGRFVFFLDSDDLLSDDFVLEQAVEAARDDGSPMVRVQKRIFDDGRRSSTERLDGKEAFFPDRAILPGAADSPDICRSWHFWLFLYERAFLDDHGIRFATRQWEERAFVCHAMAKAERITVLPVPGVSYRKRAQSTVRRTRTARDLDMMITNIEATAEALQGTVSLEPAGMQMAVAMMGEDWSTTISDSCAASPDGGAATLRRLREALSRYGLMGRPDFDADGRNMLVTDVHDAMIVASLFMEALNTHRTQFVDMALKREACPQDLSMTHLLRVPESDMDRAFQDALSLYARNERVRTASPPLPAPAGPKPRIVLHIGQTKTGSTFLQHFMEKNRAALLRAGVWYPEVGLLWQRDRPHKQAGHSAFIDEAVDGGTALRDHIEAGLALADGAIHTIVLSSEAYFLNRSSLRIVDHFAGYPVGMVGYFRRQDDWANSQYAELVAGGALDRVADSLGHWLSTTLTRERMDHHATCRLWASRIGRENVHGRLYGRRHLKDGDIVSDFLETIGLPDLDRLPRPAATQANDLPFGNAHVALLRDVNRFDWQGERDYLRFIDSVSRSVGRIRRDLKLGKPHLDLLDFDARTALMHEMAGSNERFVEAFCPQAGDFFAPPTVPATLPETTASRAEIDTIVNTLRAFEVTRGDYVPTNPLQPEKRSLPATGALPELAGISIDFVTLPPAMMPGEETEVEVALFNGSAYRLPAVLGGRPVSFSYHVLDPQGAPVIWEGPRSPLSGPIDSQAFTSIRFRAPTDPGVYLIQAAAVIEGMVWIDSARRWPLTVGGRTSP